MPFNNKQIFLKCWLWSIFGGAFITFVFWVFADIAGLFNGMNQSSTFLEVLLFLSVAGECFGAGLVGWRLTDKYYHQYTKKFLNKYIKLSLLTFILAVVIVYSPASPIAVLWNLIPPICVVLSLSKIKEGKANKKS